jgi:hypothetical protein
VRTAARWALTVLAALLVWFALLAPDEVGGLSARAFLRVPIEALVFVAVVVVLPPTARRGVAIAAGVLLGLLVVVRVLDMGFAEAIGRPFDPGSDWGYLGSAEGLLRDSVGQTPATLVTVGALLAVVALLVLLPLAVLRLSGIAARHRQASLRAVVGVGVVWVLCAVLGIQVMPGTTVASASAAELAVAEARQAYEGAIDQRAFAQASAVDAFRDTPAADLLTGLRGKDVLFVFVESYGRVAVQDSTFAPQVDAVLDAGTRQLAAAGFSARSGFLTSSTYGGISWLAHSTLQSGLRVDTQRRYNELVTSDRFTLSDAFKRAGWRTVADVPSDDVDWPEGRSFYHYDQVYNGTDVGYAGPKFSYAAVPDQWTLARFRALELARTDRTPVMAEIDLVSSHTPWAPLPHLVGWDQLGDGSVYDGMSEQGQSPTAVWRSAEQVQAAYGQSIQYSLQSLISFVTTSHDDNLVLVVLGDHQPASIVTGDDASRDVPISVIAHDPQVLDRIASWGWQDGLRPGPDAPVWAMDAFRDRFLAAYDTQPAQPRPTGAPTG